MTISCWSRNLVTSAVELASRPAAESAAAPPSISLVHSARKLLLAGVAGVPSPPARRAPTKSASFCAVSTSTFTRVKPLILLFTELDSRYHSKQSQLWATEFSTKVDRAVCKNLLVTTYECKEPPTNVKEEICHTLSFGVCPNHIVGPDHFCRRLSPHSALLPLRQSSSCEGVVAASTEGAGWVSRRIARCTCRPI